MNIFLIVCPLVFLAGFVDAIGGGGGLISLPAYLITGLPAHQEIATNKLSSACGTALTTFRFAKQKLIPWPMAVRAGTRITRPVILFVLLLLLVRIIFRP